MPIDPTYRGEARELDDLDLARIEARLEQRLALLETRLEGQLAVRTAELGAKIERRIGDQYRWWLFPAWTILFVLLVGLWMRG